MQSSVITVGDSTQSYTNKKKNPLTKPLWPEIDELDRSREDHQCAINDFFVRRQFSISFYICFPLGNWTTFILKPAANKSRPKWCISMKLNESTQNRKQCLKLDGDGINASQMYKCKFDALFVCWTDRTNILEMFFFPQEITIERSIKE